MEEQFFTLTYWTDDDFRTQIVSVLATSDVDAMREVRATINRDDIHFCCIVPNARVLEV